MKKNNKKSTVITDAERKTQDMSAVAEYDGEKSNMAKYVETLEDDYKDVPVRDTSFGGRLKNFWYHHKWVTVIVAAAIVLAIIGGVQIVNNINRGKPDVYAMYAGPVNLDPEGTENMRLNLCGDLSEDINNDGKKYVYLYTYWYCSPSEAQSLKAEASSNGLATGYDEGDNQEAYAQFKDMIAMGECGVLFLSGTLFEQVRNDGGLEKLETVLGKAPEKAIDEYGIRLCDTDIYNYYPELQIMPKDTVVCMRTRSTMMTEKAAEKTYNASARFIKDFLGFTFPEGYSGK